ncbi:hypothetical protein ACEPAI_4201 [Sanghuangporus weigelae]
MLCTLEKAILLLAASARSCTLVFGKPIVQIRDPPSSILSFDFAVHLNLSLGGSKIADLDRARATTWFAGLGRRDGSISATNTGADKKYQPTSSSVNLGKNVSVSYGSGRMLGVEYNDTITLSPDLVIKEQSIGVANTTSGFAGYDGILVDTGSTLFLLATDAFNAYTNVTGAKIDSDTGLLKIESDAYEKLESLYFSIGGTTFELTKNAQTFPRPLNEFIGGDKNATYLIVGDLGINIGAGLDFINGYAFLERFFTVYDATNQRVGFATTPNTNSTSN